ncbi:MAG: HD domain-containing protein [Spirosomataceae bacterium]
MVKTKGYSELKKFVIRKLTNHLSPDLTYHGVHHVQDVLNVCRQYIKRLKIKGREAQLLLTGALIHDIGFLYTYRDHEEKGVAIAHELLPQYGFDREEIELISGLILATKVPQYPKTKLEQIICDADLDYLGRSDFDPISESLFQELQNVNLLHNRLTWDNIQIKFLESHSYHTPYAQKYRQPQKSARLEEIKQRVAQASI